MEAVGGLATVLAQGPQEEVELDAINVDKTSLSMVFDRAWAVQLIKRAGILQAEMAEKSGPDAVRRVELLRLRFRDEKPIREIANLWGIEAVQLHREYKKARNEYLEALQHIVSIENEGANAAEIDEHCRQLMTLLQ